jgi:hypothetical protein
MPDTKCNLTHQGAVEYVRHHGTRSDLGHRARVVENQPHHLEWFTRNGDVTQVFVTMGPADEKSWRFELPEPGAADVVAFALWRGRRFVECLK